VVESHEETPMNTKQTTDSEAPQGAVRKWRKYLGPVPEGYTEKDVDDYCRHFRIDIALEFTGAKLHCFEVDDEVMP